MKLQKIKKYGRDLPTPGRVQARPNSAARGYDSKWRAARLAYLANHPFCVNCLPMYVAATVVDHVVPHRGNQQLFWDRSNWQSLCKPCHDSWKQKLENEMLAADRALW